MDNNHTNLIYRLVHTGQHYDQKMSATFFDELNIPMPDANLGCGGGTQAEQTSAIMVAFEIELVANPTDLVLVVGDVTSTMACSIVAKKLNTKVAHVEAGIRSFDLTMPEEINRISCDHASTFLFSPTKAGYDNLVAEGFKTDTKYPYNINNPKIYHCGDVMYDNSLHFANVAEQKSEILQKYNLQKDCL